MKPVAARRGKGRSSDAEPRWLLLIHQIPPHPSYLRVKIWRRLQALGAVAVKNSVYALPIGETAMEHFQWVMREIVASGGEASIYEGRLLDGLSDEDLEGLFNRARDQDYAEVRDELRTMLRDFGRTRLVPAAKLPPLEERVRKIRLRLDEIGVIDFFHAPGRMAVEGLLGQADHRIAKSKRPHDSGDTADVDGTVSLPRRRVWVTRAGIFVDRIASAWLIRRFIDREARFKFVPAKGYRPEQGELRFDMFDAEYTHEGDRCTFEVIVARHGLHDPALRAIGEIVHDIDLRDHQFGRPETPGVEHLLVGLANAHRDDAVRLDRGCAVLDDLYAFFSKSRRA